MNNMDKTVVIGVGNLLLKDDGIGVHVINELEKCELPPDVEIYDGGTGGFKLTDLMQDAERVIFIDAVDTEMLPGTITTFKSEDVRSVYSMKKYSLHDTNLLEVIKTVEILDNPPEVIIIGVQPETIDYGMELSIKLKDSMPDIIDTVLNLLLVTKLKPGNKKIMDNSMETKLP